MAPVYNPFSVVLNRQHEMEGYLWLRIWTSLDTYSDPNTPKNKPKALSA